MISEADVLTIREMEIVAYMVEGKSNDEIARALTISSKTVKNHIANVMDKIGIRSRTGIVTWAFRIGLVQ